MHRSLDAEAKSSTASGRDILHTYIYIYIHIDTHIHVYMSACIQVKRFAYRHTYMCIYISTYTCLPTHLPACLLTYLPTIHTYILTYIHTYIRTYFKLCGGFLFNANWVLPGLRILISMSFENTLLKYHGSEGCGPPTC